MYREEKTVRKLPDPKVESWYWLKKPGKKWEPVLVKPSSGSWPATIYDVHQTDVAQVSGEWGDYIPFPGE